MVLLFYGLSLLAGNPFLDIQQAPPALKAAGGIPRELGWKRSPVNWRHAAAILQGSMSEYNGREGLHRFSRRWVGGNLNMAFRVVSFLLPRREMRALQWGRNPRIKVGEIGQYQQLLRRALIEAARLPKARQGGEGSRWIYRLRRPVAVWWKQGQGVSCSCSSLDP